MKEIRTIVVHWIDEDEPVYISDDPREGIIWRSNYTFIRILALPIARIIFSRIYGLMMTLLNGQQMPLTASTPTLLILVLFLIWFGVGTKMKIDIRS